MLKAWVGAKKVDGTALTLTTQENGMPHRLFAAGLQAREIYPELKKYFYKEHSNVTWEDF